jgi:hypothetical protein
MNDKSHWESVYGTRSATEVSWFQKHPDQSLAFDPQYPAWRAVPHSTAAAEARRLSTTSRTFDVAVLDILSGGLDVGSGDWA